MNKKSLQYKNNRKVESIGVGIFVGLIIFLIFGLLTVLIPNNLFIRMTPIYFYDYILLVTISLLIALYVGMWYYIKKTT